MQKLKLAPGQNARGEGIAPTAQRWLVTALYRVHTGA